MKRSKHCHIKAKGRCLNEERNLGISYDRASVVSGGSDRRRRSPPRYVQPEKGQKRRSGRRDAPNSINS